MVVGMGDDPSIGEYERLLLSMKTTARKELVLLHPDRSVVPGSTREWLKVTLPDYYSSCLDFYLFAESAVGSSAYTCRNASMSNCFPISFFYNYFQGLVLPPKSAVHKDPDAVTALKNLKDKVQSEILKYRGGTTGLRPTRLPHTNDFARLARRICGRSIGLVLGGGGARGIAHIVNISTCTLSWT
jgi:lysophospholipid hydrolase